MKKISGIIQINKLFSFVLAIALLLSSISVALTVLALGDDINLELNGGTLNIASDYTSGDVLPEIGEIVREGCDLPCFLF